MKSNTQILLRNKEKTSPAVGIPWNKGAKNVAKQNRTPATTVLNPVLAPAFIPAADSGDISIGGPPQQPLMIVIMPQMIYNHRPLHMKIQTILDSGSITVVITMLLLLTLELHLARFHLSLSTNRQMPSRTW